MKLNWFSPLPPAKTGIADCTAYVLRALQNYAEVVVWTDQQNWNSDIEQGCNVRCYEPAAIPWGEINQADLNVYHIGNNPVFHRSIWEVSRQCPGLVILHDFKLHHFFDGIYREQQCNWDAYLSQMTRYYGLAGGQAAEQLWNGTLSIEFMAEQYPLTALALENAAGVMTHSKVGFTTLSQENRWSVGYASLPYPSQAPSLSKNDVGQTPPYRLIIFGHIATNRRLDALFEALSLLPEKSYFHLNIYGQIWNVDYVTSRIQALMLSEQVTLHGFVEADELESALANAHLAINLRYPTMGEASLSQLQIWSHALPSLVTQVGWYAELPENAVAFVRPDYEIEDIQKHLQNFLANPKQFRQMGKNGRHLLEQEHSPKVYAQAIVNFSETVKKFRHCLTAYKLVEKTGEYISTWSRHENLGQEINRVAEAIHFIGI